MIDDARSVGARHSSTRATRSIVNGERLESATVTPARELGRVERWDEGTNLTTSVAAAAADEGDAVEDSRGIISVKSETIAGVDRGGRSSRR